MVGTRHVFETYIRSTPNDVWEAITDPSFTRRYHFGLAVSSGWEPGDRYSYDGAIEGTIEEIDPPHRMVMTYRLLFDADAAAEPPSRVTWEITPVGDVVRVTCIHGDLALSPATWRATADRWNVILCGLKTLLETGDVLGDVPDDGRSPFAPGADDTDVTWHRGQAVAANDATYELLGRDDRTSDDDDRMVHLAHASTYHWGLAGTAAHRARGEYLCSRVYSFLGRAEPALHHAGRCLALCDAADLQDFDRFFAHEATARALAAARRTDEAVCHVAQARAVPIADDADRAICEADLAAGPWYGVAP